MNIFDDLLNTTCDIQARALNKSGYETTKSWNTKETDVPCRKEENNSTNFQDNEIRINTDEHLFFMNTGVNVEQGERLVHNGENFKVIKVNLLHEEQDPHHLEVTVKEADHD